MKPSTAFNPLELSLARRWCQLFISKATDILTNCSTLLPMSKKQTATRVEMSLRFPRTSMIRLYTSCISGVLHSSPSPGESWLIFGHRPFQDAVKAGTGNIMCSYNRINNSYGCSNSKTQNGLLKTELGFQVSFYDLVLECL